MTTRIVFIGAESTGKSTLATQVAERLGLPLTREFARLYVERVARPLDATDVEPIARGQLAEEDRFGDAETVLHDTNLLSTLIYARHYYSSAPEWLEQSLTRRRYALYLFCQPDIPWVADHGQRESEAARAVLHRAFEAQLEQRGATVVRIQGDAQARLALAISAVESIVER